MRPGLGHAAAMLFACLLHEGILAGTITESVRIWQRPHVTVGKRYRFGPGEKHGPAWRVFRVGFRLPARPRAPRTR